MRIPAVLLAVIVLAAGASQAQTTDSPQPAAEPTAAAQADQPPAADPAAQAADATPAQRDEAQAAAKPPRAPAGFKLQKRKDGTYLFCQEVSRVGTRFTEKVCFTEEQYAELERRSQSMRESMQKPSACTGINCAGG